MLIFISKSIGSVVGIVCYHLCNSSSNGNNQIITSEGTVGNEPIGIADESGNENGQDVAEGVIIKLSFNK